MTHFSDGTDERHHPGCLQCEALLTDAAEGTLDVVDQALFDRHLQVCAGCTSRFAEAQRGLAWLALLKTPRPEPSAELLDRIHASVLADTETEKDSAWLSPVSVLPAQPRRGELLPFPARPAAAARGWLPAGFDPRLAMTAAMAFFSIALTLNLTGVRFTELHAQDFTPAGVTRGFYNLRADAVRTYEGLRVVHVLESRVEELKAAGIALPISQPPDERKEPDNGTRHPARTPAGREDPAANHGVSRNMLPAPGRHSVPVAAVPRFTLKEGRA